MADLSSAARQLHDTRNAKAVLAARAAGDTADRAARDTEAFLNRGVGSAPRAPTTYKSVLNAGKSAASSAADIGKGFGTAAGAIGKAGVQALPVAGNIVSGGLALKGMYDMATDPSQRTFSRGAETVLDTVGAIPVLGNASNALRFGSKVAGAGAAAAGLLRAGLDSSSPIEDVSVNPAEVTQMRANKPPAAPTAPSAEPSVEPNLQQAIAARASNVEGLRSSVNEARGAYNDARNQGVVDAAAQMVPGMAEFAMLSAPRRADPELRDLQSAMGNLKNATAAQTHDDKVGIELGTLGVNQATANAKLNMDRATLLQKAREDSRKGNEETITHAAGVYTDENGKQQPNIEMQSTVRRLLAESGVDVADADEKTLNRAIQLASVAHKVDKHNKNNAWYNPWSGPKSKGPAASADALKPLGKVSDLTTGWGAFRPVLKTQAGEIPYSELSLTEQNALNDITPRKK